MIAWAVSNGPYQGVGLIVTRLYPSLAALQNAIAEYEAKTGKPRKQFEDYDIVQVDLGPPESGEKAEIHIPHSRITVYGHMESE